MGTILLLRFDETHLYLCRHSVGRAPFAHVHLTMGHTSKVEQTRTRSLLTEANFVKDSDVSIGRNRTELATFQAFQYFERPVAVIVFQKQHFAFPFLFSLSLARSLARNGYNAVQRASLTRSSFPFSNGCRTRDREHFQLAQESEMLHEENYTESHLVA